MGKNTFRQSLVICLLTTLSVVCQAQMWDTKQLAYWNFDRVQNNNVHELVSGENDTLGGYHRLVEGIIGKAIVMDGYTSHIIRPAKKAPKLGKAFTIEAWIAIGAYPWNWAPIVTRENTVSTNSNLDEICWSQTT